MAIPRNLSILAQGASASGVLGPTYGGTGLTSPGANGNVLTSNGTTWTSAAPAGGVTSLTAGNGITVSASTGAVTVSQDIYTGSAQNNTSYPIGTTVLINSDGITSALNSSATLYYHTVNTDQFYKFSGASRVAITGTWRARGFLSSDGTQGQLFQRTA